MEDLVALIVAVCLPLLCVPVLQRLERTDCEGKFADGSTRDANVVVLDPDVAEVFPDSDSVNHALRVLCGQQSHGPVAEAVVSHRDTEA